MFWLKSNRITIGIVLLYGINKCALRKAPVSFLALAFVQEMSTEDDDDSMIWSRKIPPPPGRRRVLFEASRERDGIVHSSLQEKEDQHPVDIIMQLPGKESITKQQHQPQKGGRNTSQNMGTTGSFPPMPKSKIDSNIKLTKSMFQHAYDAYMYNAYPASELKPISCTPGTFDLVRLPALTLIDSLDTLIVMGNHTEFARSVERLRSLDNEMKSNNKIWQNSNERGGIFAVNQNVSVFETNIRVLGGLLSAHQMAQIRMKEKTYLHNVINQTDGSVLIGHDVDMKHEPSTEDSCSSLQEEDDLEKSQFLKNKHIYMEKCKESGLPTEICEMRLYNETQCTENINLEENKVHTSLEYWHYDGFLLSLADDIGLRLLPAFDTKTGIPFGTVNLLYGIPPDETTIASLAGAGTLSIEMELLSRLTGNDSFGKAAKLAVRALWTRRSSVELVGKHIDVQTGVWKEPLSGIGSNSDSFYEYLLKHYLLFPEDDDFWIMFQSMYTGIFNYARWGDWYIDVEMYSGAAQRIIFENLAAFYPGVQVLLGEVIPSSRTTNSFSSVREYLSFLPERFDFQNWKVDYNGGLHPLRPELHESAYYLNMATRQWGISKDMKNSTNFSSGWLWGADFALHALEESTKTNCGYGMIEEVTPKSLSETINHEEKLQDEMPSFFLSETLKYLYLSFESNNPLDNDRERGWIYTTEAHPVYNSGGGVENINPVDYDDEDRSNDNDDEFAITRVRLLNLLEKEEEQVTSNITLYPFNVESLDTEQWNTATSLFNFKHDLTLARNSLKQRSVTQNDFANIYGRITEKDEIKSAGSGGNDSHINFASFRESHHGKGPGFHLSKSCPNYHNSNALWIEALNGVDIGYSADFITTIDSKEESEDTPSALAFSAFLGTDYLSSEGQQRTCQERKKKSIDQVFPFQPPNETPEGSSRINVGGNLGEFDISIYDGGLGYFVKHVSSGESIEVAIFSVGTGDGTSVVVTTDSYHPVRSTNVQPTSRLHGPSRVTMSEIFPSRVSHVQTKTDSSKHIYDRTMVVSDLSGNSFFCEIDIIYSTGPQREDILSTFPCLSAMYGPTQMKTLVETNGVDVQASLKPLDSAHPFGCNEGHPQNDNDEPSILLVQRGKCTFRRKTLNQMYEKSPVKAVIIINSEENKLFVMDAEENQERGYENEPVSVLVSKNDGGRIMDLLQSYSSGNAMDKSPVYAKIRLNPQHDATEEKPLKPIKKWPVVTTEPGKIQALAYSGWGLSALQKTQSEITSKGSGNDNKNWEIMMLQHSLHEKNP